jgi:glycosyltransferase involved in cell wall biosynthesis
MREKGFEVAKRFSWEKTAQQTLDVFRLVLERSRRLPLLSTVVGSPVTPSYQQARFIEKTLKSVITQDYPYLEYLVIDGGSTDGTLDILQGYANSYPDRVKCVSEPDRGQTDALNKGFRCAKGQILGWLNSDDVYEEGAVRRSVEAFQESPSAAFVYGRAEYLGARDEKLGTYPTLAPFDWDRLAHNCYICQPAAFIRRQAAEEIGFLNQHLQWCMDYDLWIRLGKGRNVVFIDSILAYSRLHPRTKTFASRKDVYREIIKTVRRHYGYVPYSWLLGCADFLLNQADQITITRSPSTRAKWLATVLFIAFNMHRPELVWNTLAAR